MGLHGAAAVLRGLEATCSPDSGAWLRRTPGSELLRRDGIGMFEEICESIRVCMYMHVCRYIFTYTYAYSYVYVYMCMCIYTYVI